MGPFEMVVLIVFIATAGKVAEALLSRLTPRAPDEERLKALEAEVRANEARVLQNEEQVAELSEKLGFMEALLASPARHAELPTSPQAPPVPTPVMKGEAAE